MGCTFIFTIQPLILIISVGTNVLKKSRTRFVEKTTINFTVSFKVIDFAKTPTEYMNSLNFSYRKKIYLRQTTISEIESNYTQRVSPMRYHRGYNVQKKKISHLPRHYDSRKYKTVVLDYRKSHTSGLSCCLYLYIHPALLIFQSTALQINKQEKKKNQS